MLYPMFMMIVLTFIVLFFMVSARFASVKTGEMQASFFSLMSGEEMTERVAKTTRNLSNQFEMPILFYVGCTLYLVFGIDSIIGLVFAWLFVASRYVHAYIHIGSNSVMPRMRTYAFGGICIMALWINLLVLQMG